MTMLKQQQHQATIGNALLLIDDEDFVYGYHEGYETYQTYHHNKEGGVDTSTLLFLLKNGWDAGHSDLWNTGYIAGWLAAFYEQEDGQFALSTYMITCCERR